MTALLMTAVSCHQYNEKGISCILNITIDESQPKEYVGTLDGHSIFVEKLKIDELYFTTVDAENISFRDAIAKGSVTIEDWRKGAWRITKSKDTEILRYENYEIAITGSDCTVRPITK